MWKILICSRILRTPPYLNAFKTFPFLNGKLSRPIRTPHCLLIFFLRVSYLHAMIKLCVRTDESCMSIEHPTQLKIWNRMAETFSNFVYWTISFLLCLLESLFFNNKQNANLMMMYSNEGNAWVELIECLLLMAGSVDGGGKGGQKFITPFRNEFQWYLNRNLASCVWLKFHKKVWAGEGKGARLRYESRLFSKLFPFTRLSEVEKF